MIIKARTRKSLADRHFLIFFSIIYFCYICYLLSPWFKKSVNFIAMSLGDILWNIIEIEIEKKDVLWDSKQLR